MIIINKHSLKGLQMPTLVYTFKKVNFLYRNLG